MARGTGNITVLAITAVLLTAAVYEGGLGLLQLLGMEPSGNRLYPFTGSFYNPGPFACYLALSLPWALYTISNEKLAIHKIISNEELVISNLWDSVHNKLNYSLLITNCALIEAWIVVGLDAVLLPASMSRTAWCAAVVGGIVALFGSKVILFGSRLKDVCTKNSPLPHRPSPLILHSSPSPHRPSPLTPQYARQCGTLSPPQHAEMPQPALSTLSSDETLPERAYRFHRSPKEANILLSTKEKVPSPAVEQMRKEAGFIIAE